jgi:hypothetical protein
VHPAQISASPAAAAHSAHACGNARRNERHDTDAVRSARGSLLRSVL